MICHDGSYPEAPRCLVLGGAKALFWLIHNGNLSKWAELYAFWNVVPIFTCNPAGTGHSIFVDVHGNPFDAAGTSEAFVFAEVDLKEQAKFREEGKRGDANHLRVRRTDLYGPICMKK